MLLLVSAVAVVAVFLCASAFARSLRPEIERLGVLGGGTRVHGCGAAVLLTTTSIGCAVGMVTAPPIADAWSHGIADLALAPLPPSPSHGAGTIASLTALFLLPALGGWWSGATRSSAHRHRSRVIAAAAVAALFVLPTVGVVVAAPALIDIVGHAGQTVAADRLGALGTTAGALAVSSAATFGLVIGTTIVAADAVRGALRVAARSAIRGPLWLVVGLQLAARRAERFGPIATVSAGTTGIVSGQAIATTLEQPGGTSSATWSELTLTLGPTLLIALGAAVGAAFAQSRGTGGDLRSLALTGWSWSARASIVLVAAVALGGSGAVVGALAAGAAALFAVPVGITLGTVGWPDLVVPITVAAGLTATTALVFLLSELWGSRITR
ncbi:hypothetical protein [Curtobacterium sp. L1-20]|uniref:hypothetical protein n=1 Tax=Curtobacterium sp. L1-20 TaxID=3138181 RepID=UPI003B52A4CC